MVLFIMLVLSVVAVRSFSVFRVNNALEMSHDAVVSAISEARNFTLFSKDATVYGVHFGSTTVTRFTGSSYTEDLPTNKVYKLEPSVNISRVNIIPFSYNITYARLTGEPSATGTIEISANSDINKKNTVIINESGLAE